MEIELRTIHLPLVRPFRTSFGTQTSREVLIVKVTNENGTTGWAEWTYEGGGTEYCAAKSGPWVGMLPSSVADTPCYGGYMVW